MNYVLMVLLLFGYGNAVPLHRNDPSDPIVFPMPAPPTTAPTHDSTEQNRHHRSIDLNERPSRAVFPAPEPNERPKRQLPPKDGSFPGAPNDLGDELDLANRVKRHIPAEDGTYPSAIDFEDLGMSHRPGRGANLDSTFESERFKREDGGYPATRDSTGLGADKRPRRAVFPAPQHSGRPKRDATGRDPQTHRFDDFPESQEFDDFSDRFKRNADSEKRPKREIPPRDSDFHEALGSQTPPHPKRAVFPAPEPSNRPKRESPPNDGHFPDSDSHRYPPIDLTNRSPRQIPTDHQRFPGQLDAMHSFGSTDQQPQRRAVFPAPEPANRPKRDAGAESGGHWEVYHYGNGHPPLPAAHNPPNRPKREIPKEKSTSSPFKGFPPIRRQPEASIEPDLALVMNGRKRSADPTNQRPKRSASEFFGYENANGNSGRPKRRSDAQPKPNMGNIGASERLDGSQRSKRSAADAAEHLTDQKRPKRSTEIPDSEPKVQPIRADPKFAFKPKTGSPIDATEPVALHSTSPASSKSPENNPPAEIPQPNSEVYPLPSSPDGRRQFPAGDHPTATEDHFPEIPSGPLKEPTDGLEAKMQDLADFRPLPTEPTEPKGEKPTEKNPHSETPIPSLPMDEFSLSAESQPSNTEPKPRVGPQPISESHSAESKSNPADPKPRISPIPIEPQPMHQFHSRDSQNPAKWPPLPYPDSHSREIGDRKSLEPKNRRKRDAQFPDSISMETFELGDFLPADQKPIPASDSIPPKSMESHKVAPFYPDPSDPRRTNPHPIIDPPPNDPSGPLDGDERIHHYPHGNLPKTDGETQRDDPRALDYRFDGSVGQRRQFEDSVGHRQRRDTQSEPRTRSPNPFSRKSHSDGQRVDRRDFQTDPWEPRRPMDEHKPSGVSPFQRRYPTEHQNEMRKPLEPLENHMTAEYPFGDGFDPLDDPYDPFEDPYYVPRATPTPQFPLGPMEDQPKPGNARESLQKPLREPTHPQPPLDEPIRRENPSDWQNRRENPSSGPNRRENPFGSPTRHPSPPSQPIPTENPPKPRDPLHPRGQEGRPNPWDPLGRRPAPPLLFSDLLLGFLRFPHGDTDPQKQSPDELDAVAPRSLGESSKGGIRRPLRDVVFPQKPGGWPKADPKRNPMDEGTPNWAHSNEETNHWPTNPNPFEGRITTDFQPSPPYESSPMSPFGTQQSGYNGNGFGGLNGNQPNGLYPNPSNGFNGNPSNGLTSNQPNGLYPNPPNGFNGNPSNGMYPTQPNGFTGNPSNGLYPNQPSGLNGFQPNPPNSNGFGQPNGQWPNGPNGAAANDWTTGSMP